MKTFLKIFFAAIFVLMLWLTIRASLLQGSVLVALGRMLQDPWAAATLADANCAFLTFFVWLAYRERSWLARIVWLLAVLGLGNLAMSSYVLWQLFHLKPGQGVESLLKPK